MTESANTIIDLAQIIATICAAASAIFAAYQIYSDAIWRRKERAYSHSPYRNKELYNSLEKLSAAYPILNDRQSHGVVTCKIQKNNVADLEKAANLWGHMASEYYAGLIDRELARKAYSVKFLRFCAVFEDWLKRDGRENIFVDTLKLYNEWNNYNE